MHNENPKRRVCTFSCSTQIDIYVTDTHKRQCYVLAIDRRPPLLLRLPVWERVRGGAEAEAEPALAESTAPGILRSHCGCAACRQAAARMLHPESFCIPDAQE